MTTPVFASAIQVYYRAGWPAILPVPSETKFPPPVGFTGDAGADTTPEQLVVWATNGMAEHSVALRMPDGVIGIDVDHYTKGDKVKTGADTLAAAVERWGELPPTWHSTARGDDEAAGPSRIMFFRVPAGRYVTVLRPDVEIIQRHHRYAVVWPSPHAEIGTTYFWYRPDGTLADEGEVPRPDDLPELPQAWVVGLREGASEAGPAAADIGSGWALLRQLQIDERPACAEISDAALTAQQELHGADAGSRHDTMVARVHRIVMLGAGGHPGSGAALRWLGEQWAELTVGEGREAEYESMMLTSARKAATVVGGKQVPADPCLSFGGFEVIGPAPVDDRGDSDAPPLPGPIQEPVPYSWRHVIGTHLFDPNADLDQTLAAEVLQRTWPMIRHASDSGGWVQRGPVQWELHKDLTRRAGAEVAWLMPTGDPAKPEKGTPPTNEQKQFARRKRMLTNASAGAVANSMKALVMGGWHPSAVRLADLDSDPELLWAAGMPYDLRASREGPTFAQVDMNTPHLVSAGVAPEVVPTPTWDRFIAQVWPDAEVRAWALRVLSIALTGYADAALPVLMGEGGSGKTSTVELLMSVLGSYAHAANPKLLSGEQSHDSIIFALKGRRLSFIDEGPREGRWAQERLKQLTGGGQLTGNAMNQNPITFRPTHTLVLTTNDEPMLNDEAVRRRIRLIPCHGDVSAVRAARAAITPKVWAAEAPGVLAMFMAQTARWLAEPDSALTAAAPLTIRGIADELGALQDPTRLWVEEMCEAFPDGTSVSDLRRQFVAWCRDMNIRNIPNDTVWGTRLTKLGYPATHRRNGRYRGLRVRAGGGGGFSWGPTDGPPFAGVTGSPPAGDGSVMGSGVDPSQPETPGQPLFSSSSVKGVKGLLPIRREEEEEEDQNSTYGVIEQNNSRGGTFAQTLHTEPPQTASDLHVKGSTDPSHAGETHHTPTEGANQAVEPSKSSRSVTNSDVAARAYQGGPEKKITKAEARKLLQAEARQQAIDEAAGEVHKLPAVVNRAGTVVPVSPEQAVATVRSEVTRTGALTVDVETSGYPVGHEYYVLRSVQLGGDQLAVVLHPVDHAVEIRVLLAEAPKLHAHSASADLVPLAHAGLVDAEAGWAKMHDTVIPAKLADPQSTGSDPGLKKLSEAVLGAESTAPFADAGREALWKAARWQIGKQPFLGQLTTPLERNGWAQVPTGCTTMLRYAASDVLDTAALAQRLPEIPDAVLGRERLFEEMTARVAHRGLRLDTERVRELNAKHEQLKAEAAARVRAFGVENPGSVVQVAEALAQLGEVVPKTAKGNPSVEKHVLQIIVRSRPDTPAGQLAAAVLDYKHSATALGLFLGPYTALCEHADARMRPIVYTLGTDTGRTSCVRPNAQQLSREGGVRSVVTADPGHVLISADFSGVELRGAAGLSQDPTMMHMIAEEDAGRFDGFHWQVARQAFGPQATKADRYIAKRGCFGTFYGGGAEGLAKQVGVPVSEMEAIRTSLRDVAPAYFSWANQIQAAVRCGWSNYESYSGRVIHFDVAKPHKAPAYMIQGSCRELLVDALMRWRDTQWGNCTLLPVHDELIVMVPEEDAEDATRELVRCMQGDLYGVKIIADPSEPSFAWADSS
jgi:P4 family phage/plasmid primase-like protien